MGINFRGGRRFLVLLCAVIMGLVVLVFIPTMSNPGPYSAERNTLNTINTEISALQQPLSPRVSPELFKQQQEDIAVYIKTINSGLAKKDIEASSVVLLQLKNSIWQMGDPLKGVIPSKQMKVEHDPEDKYLKVDPIDPAIEKWYLPIVDMLVKFDYQK